MARQFVGVLGNSDLPPLRDRLPRREVLRLHGWAIGVCHPYWGGFPDGIADEILGRDFADLRLDVLLFGHTHDRLAERRSGSPEGPRPSDGGDWGVSPQLLLVNPGPGYADFMSPASLARLRVSPAGIEAELVVLGEGR